MKYSPFALGATLYMPATRDDIVAAATGRKIPSLKSMVICLEDAVADSDVEFALNNLQLITKELAQKKSMSSKPLVFIRPRNTEMAKYIVANYDLSGVNGFVFPKFTLDSLEDWAQITSDTHLIWMPTLETRDVFDASEMQKLATALSIHPMKDRIIALRIGGNDLMSVIGVRRSRTATIYQGPLSYVIKMLTCTFGALGFSLTSPVFELIEKPELLQEEIEQDLIHGLVGKTAIHPTQIEYIQNAWMVDHAEYEDALRIINSTKAVYQHAGAMCEPATHRQWAKNILERSKLFGINHTDMESLSI
ncbi:HpcH/HpaI aldolase/citrate lyase family protein [Photobacterium carnosum]|uniref:HpcH/HpaI aldolase/citrate lyase family protein n=1 Tax=Photobacterium carnosum TaxID=2023717 RepID=UPI0024320979|nr:HpcH/HpaI aldolase/citrate lyase family protein [Photobacterium carnosum]